MQEWIRLQYQVETVQPDDVVSYGPVVETESASGSGFVPEYVEEVGNEEEFRFEEEEEEEEDGSVDIEIVDDEYEDDHIPLTERNYEGQGGDDYRLRMMERTLTEIQKYVETLLVMIRQDLPASEPTRSDVYGTEVSDGDGVILCGTFNGEEFVDETGEAYAVPPNYASKSKLVQGDAMKLSFGQDGRLLYKQLEPTKRRRIRGVLVQDEDTGAFHVVTREGKFKVLATSVSYYSGVPGDDVVLVIPQSGFSHWGAIETIIRKL